ncbi:DNA polymerase Y family protein [Alcaligenes sp. SDU_A2]|uniref:DNA polymerase Y family protein n=1 Tax=Alcaligenes sp. SDU_A2 TaxID=3136634 RepID=UPI00311FFE74
MLLYLCLLLPDHDKQPDACKQQAQTLLPLLLSYSPQLAQPCPGVLLLNLGASLMLFGGLRPLYRRLHHDLQALLPTAHLALAPTARAAWLLALSGNRQRRCLRRLPTLLDTLPLELLNPLPDQLRWLHSLGCLSLGALRQLPRDGLAQRGLRDLLLRLDQAYGEQALVLEWLPAPLSYQHSLELDTPSRASGPLLHGLRILLSKLEHWLEQGQLACGQILVVLHADSPRRPAPPASLNIQMARPCWRCADFLLLIQERLQSLSLPAPILRLDMHALQLHPRQSQPSSLFPDARHWQDQDLRLLERLQARLGTAYVLRPAPQASYLPEQANQWQPALVPTSTAPVQTPPLQRPAWLLEHARPLKHDSQRLWLDGRRLRLLQGPERIQSGWWADTGHQQRDYFVAQDRHGQRYWVYRDLTQEHAWYLHGVFG